MAPRASRRAAAAFPATVSTAILMVLIVSGVAHAQIEKSVYTFCEVTNCPDGSIPDGRLIAYGDNMYGTTTLGGANNAGTVFRLAPDYTETVIYSFGANSDDGTAPSLGVTADNQGNLYGVTEDGGAHSWGTVFKVSPEGIETILYTFGATDNDAAFPYGPVVVDEKGNVYGATTSGGKYGYGTVFRISTTGRETILHNFDPNSGDGYEPISGLTLDSKGNLYGTTSLGGTFSDGTVYTLTENGEYSILYNFGTNPNDGNTANSPVTLDSEGNIYGVTQFGGATGNGTAFKLIPGSPWTEIILQSFAGFTAGDASQPWGPLVMDSAGNLYGASFNGGRGIDNSGTIFEVGPNGGDTLLYVFIGVTGGEEPSGGLLRDSHGNMYGTTYFGGYGFGAGNGVVYKLTP